MRNDQADTAIDCPRGVAIVTSDYMSTNVALSRLDGTTESPSFVSSAAAKPGLALALSGDVVLPSARPESRRLVLLDRFGSNVLTWMDVETAEVLGQLPVGQGFESNPHDYLEIDSTRAFVTRYGTNPTPGAKPFDAGDDVLIVDTRAPAILGRVAIPEEDARLRARPSAMTAIGGDVIVSLGRLALDFGAMGDGRFVGISPKTSTITWTVEVPGLQNCGKLAASPSGHRLALACSSAFDPATNRFDPAKSDVVLYDAETRPPSELKRFGLGVALGSGIQPALAFARDDLLLGAAFGGNANPGDLIFSLEVETGEVTPLGDTTAPFSLGGVWCAPGCGDVCLIADAEKRVLRRWRVGPSGLEPMPDATVETTVGLPPRSLGPF